MPYKSTANYTVSLPMKAIKSISLKAEEHVLDGKSLVLEQSSSDEKSTTGKGDLTDCSINIKHPYRKLAAESFLPSRFFNVIPSIANCIEAGYICFLNPKTLEIEQVPGMMLDNPEAYYASSGTFSRQKPFNHLHWGDCVMFEPVPVKELYRLIGDYMQYITDYPFREKVTQLMRKQKPYEKINVMIIKSIHSAGWIDYKAQHFETLIGKRMAMLFNNEHEAYMEQEDSL